MKLTSGDIGTLAICALRYCFGRKTYMPGLVIAICSMHLTEYNKKDLLVMIEDCAYRKRMFPPGDDCDEADWEKWESRLLAERDRRARKA